MSFKNSSCESNRHQIEHQSPGDNFGTRKFTQPSEFAEWACKLTSSGYTIHSNETVNDTSAFL